MLLMECDGGHEGLERLDGEGRMEGEGGGDMDDI